MAASDSFQKEKVGLVLAQEVENKEELGLGSQALLFYKVKFPSLSNLRVQSLM